MSIIFFFWKSIMHFGWAHWCGRVLSDIILIACASLCPLSTGNKLIQVSTCNVAGMHLNWKSKDIVYNDFAVFFNFCPLLVADGIMYFGLSVRPCVRNCVCPKSCWRKISKMYEWIYFKFFGRVNINKTMNWLDLGFHRSKSRSMQDQIWSKIQLRRHA